MDVSGPTRTLEVDHVRPSNWREELAPQFDAHGWADRSCFNDLDHDIAVSCIEFEPESDGVVVTDGPPTFCIATFLDGRGSLSIDGGQPLDVEPGTTVIFHSQACIRGENKVCAGRRIQIIDIRYAEPFLKRLGGMPTGLLSNSLLIDRSATIAGALLVGFKTPRPLLDVAQQIADCSFENVALRQIYLRAKALETLALTIDALANAADAARILSVRDRRKLNEARRLIEEQFDEPWTIPLLARTVGLNERKLKLGFRTIVGRSVRAYLRHTRIKAAAGMLADGHRVTDVAVAVGFGNISHFSKIFRNTKGASPSTYLRASR